MSTIIDTIIVDDELYSRDELKHLLAMHGDIKLIGEAGSPSDALKLILEAEPKLVFLDIDMPQMNGMELAETITKMKQPPFIVFATAHADYAARAFRVDALDYLLKPFDEDELHQTLKRVRIQLSKRNTEPLDEMTKLTRLAVEVEGRIRYIEPSSILYIVREERETVIFTKSESFRMKTSLKDLKQKLRGYPFHQSHKSYIVNLAEIDQLIPWFNGAFQLKMKGRDDDIPVSRTYVKELREKLEL